MGLAASKGWIDLGLTTLGASLTVAEKVDGYRTGKQTRKVMAETAPHIRANLDAVTSYLGHRQLVEQWGAYTSGVGLAVQALEVLQGKEAHKAMVAIGARVADNAEAQTALMAPKKFAEQVHHFINQQTSPQRRWPSKGRLHVFFLYHPDTDWDPAFFHRIQGQPLSKRFLGMSQNLDAIVAFMKFIKDDMRKQGRKIHIHLLIPSYRPIVIGDTLAFPDKLMPLTIHGHIHGSTAYVWLNLPRPSRRLHLLDIGNLADLRRDDPDRSQIGLTLLGGAATLIAGSLGGPAAAVAVGTFVAGNVFLNPDQSQSPVISDARARILSEAPAEDSDDDRSSDDEEERQARRHDPATGRVRRGQRHKKLPRGFQ